MHSIERRDKETKYVSDALKTSSGISLATPQRISADISSSSTEFFVVVPPTVQGDDNFTRIGNQLSPTRCSVKLRLSLNQLLATLTTVSVDITVHIFLLTNKSVKDYILINAMDPSELLRIGDGTNSTFDGSSYVSAYPVNTDAYTVLTHKVIRMRKNFGQQGITDSTATTATGTVQPLCMDPSMYRTLSFNVPLPKVLKYEDSTKIYPSNAAPFLAIGWYYNGPPVAPISTAVLTAEGQTQLWFKDA